MGLRRLLHKAPSTTPGASDELAFVDALAAEGRLIEAVDLLATINRRRRDPEAEVKLIDLRAQAAAHYDAGVGRTPWPPAYADPFPHVVGQIPEVSACELTTDILGGAVSHHGCLIVRGVFSDAQVALSVNLIERVRRHRERMGLITEGSAGDLSDAAWYRPLATDQPMDAALRQRVGAVGGTWLADSPTGTAQILDDLEAAGVTPAISGHLGERPFFSLQKSTLRRIVPVSTWLAAWHQDGSFLDPAVRTMDAWVALSRCGGTHPTPGLEVVPKRIPELLPVTSELVPYSISYDLVAEVAADTPTVVPEFAAGDAIMFDERCLHRTHLSDGMSETRYALECWFFAPSHHSPTYTPLLV